MSELTQVSDPQAISYLRSMITTQVSHQAGEDAETTVEHRVQFDIEPGAVADMNHSYGEQLFRPTRMVVVWRDGELDDVTFTGLRVLKAGLSTKGEYREKRIWREYRDGERLPIKLPEAVATTVTAYENTYVEKGVSS